MIFALLQPWHVEVHVYPLLINVEQLMALLKEENSVKKQLLIRFSELCQGLVSVYILEH